MAHALARPTVPTKRFPDLGALQADEQEAARELGVSLEAVQLARGSERIDLHVEALLAPRLLGYDFRRPHGPAPFYGHMMGHADLPRLQSGLTGAMWVITTNPFRTAAGRWQAFLTNLARVRAMLAEAPGCREVHTRAEYDAARAAGRHAALLAIQGGDALTAAPDGPASIPDRAVTRVTLVHLTSSEYGVTSSPFALWRSRRGLSPSGVELVRALDRSRIFVDLAHVNPPGFWDAVAAHDRSLPLLATHTGVSGVRPHWRNLDDRQIRAIADTGGTIGIIFSVQFLKRRGGPADGRMVVEHMRHVIDVAGEDFVSIGSDYDGMIIPPPDLRSVLTYPRLVQHMLDEGWSVARIQKVLGGNFLRAFAQLRP